MNNDLQQLEFVKALETNKRRLDATKKKEIVVTVNDRFHNPDSVKVEYHILDGCRHKLEDLLRNLEDHVERVDITWPDGHVSVHERRSPATPFVHAQTI